MAPRTPSERVLAGRIGAYVVHSRYDSRELTAAARAAFRDKFQREVDPDGTLPPAERARRAEMARKAHYARLALKSAKARRKRASRCHATTSATRALGPDDVSRSAEP